MWRLREFDYNVAVFCPGGKWSISTQFQAKNRRFLTAIFIFEYSKAKVSPKLQTQKCLKNVLAVEVKCSKPWLAATQNFFCDNINMENILEKFSTIFRVMSPFKIELFSNYVHICYLHSYLRSFVRSLRFIIWIPW